MGDQVGYSRWLQHTEYSSTRVLERGTNLDKVIHIIILRWSNQLEDLQYMVPVARAPALRMRRRSLQAARAKAQTSNVPGVTADA